MMPTLRRILSYLTLRDLRALTRRAELAEHLRERGERFQVREGAAR